MRRILKYKYYNTRKVYVNYYRLKVLKSKKEKWKFFIQKRNWFIKKLLRKSKKFLKKERLKTKISLYPRRKRRFKSKLKPRKFKNKSWKKYTKISRNYLKTYVKRVRWYKIKKANPFFIFKRIYYINYEKFFTKGYLNKEFQNSQNKKRDVALRRLRLKPLFNYSVFLSRATLLSTVHESLYYLRSSYCFKNTEKVKTSNDLFVGDLYSIFSKMSWKNFIPLKTVRCKFKQKFLLLLFAEIDYYTKALVVIKNFSELKNKECTLLVH